MIEHHFETFIIDDRAVHGRDLFSTPRIISSKSSGSKGLLIRPAAPRKASTAPAFAYSLAVKITTGMPAVAASDLSRTKTSHPVNPGITRSRRMILGLLRFA